MMSSKQGSATPQALEQASEYVLVPVAQLREWKAMANEVAARSVKAQRHAAGIKLKQSIDHFIDPKAERTALEQYDLKRSPHYRKGWDDGRKKGYEVGHRHGLEQHLFSKQPAAEPLGFIDMSAWPPVRWRESLVRADVQSFDGMPVFIGPAANNGITAAQLEAAHAVTDGHMAKALSIKSAQSIAMHVNGVAVDPYHQGGDPDPLYEKAVELVRRENKTRISYVQRMLKITYNRAARLLETMELQGIVSHMSSQGLREVLKDQTP